MARAWPCAPCTMRLCRCWSRRQLQDRQQHPWPAQRGPLARRSVSL
jgi:hypothetical protein